MSDLDDPLDQLIKEIKKRKKCLVKVERPKGYIEKEGWRL